MRKIKKIVVLGGGLTGLTAAYYLTKENYQVTVFEKESVLGGLASGFKEENWDWFLEKTVHHLFSNDNDFLNFAKEIGFKKVFFRSPETASFYEFPISDFKFSNKSQASNVNFQIFPLDAPLDLLRFPLLSFFDRVRAGMVLAGIKISPFFPFYEKRTSQEFLEKTMGKKAYMTLFK